MHIVQAERASLASYNISRKLVRPSQFLENFTQILTWSTLQKKIRSLPPTQYCSMLKE